MFRSAARGSGKIKQSVPSCSVAGAARTCMSEEITIVDDRGKGRPFVLLHEAGSYSDLASGLLEAIAPVTRTVLLTSAAIGDRNWSELSEELIATLSQLAIRQASFVSFGAAGALIQHLALLEVKLARTIVFVDASTRPHPSAFARAVDFVERKLPLGLPLRSHSRGFDGRAFLQRIRCPVLVLTSSRASHYQRAQSELMMQNLPTAWSVDIAGVPSEGAALSSQVLDFQKVAAKCPQKNLEAA